MSKTGIYAIRNIQNNCLYIGQSLDIDVRYENHLKHLRAKKHPSVAMQRDYNRWLRDSYANKATPWIFELLVLIECRPGDLSRLEKIFIKVLKPKYNVNKFRDIEVSEQLAKAIKMKFDKEHNNG